MRWSLHGDKLNVRHVWAVLSLHNMAYIIVVKSLSFKFLPKQRLKKKKKKRQKILFIRILLLF